MPPRFKIYWRRTAALLALGAWSLSFFAVPGWAQPKTFAKVKWVIDGDTFDTATDERIRLIGVNAPEYRPWKGRVDPYGKEASNYAKKLLAGKKVQLETDVGRKDKYGRTLAYVYLENGVFVNYHLIAQGYARHKYYKPNGRYREKLKQAEKIAKKENRGLWAGKKQAAPKAAAKKKAKKAVPVS